MKLFSVFLIPAIIDILIRFHWHDIGFTSDVAKAFLNMEIAEEHRDVLRMLWIDDIFTDNPHLLVKRFQRVVFGLKPSPFLLNGTVKYHISKYELEDPQFVAQFLASVYVDDLISGNGTVPEAFQFYLKANERLLEAGFNLRKFLSNSSELMKLINEREGTVIQQGYLVDGSLTLEDQSYTKSSLNCAEKIEENSE